MLKLNMANWDRIARFIIGIVLLVLALTGTVAGVLGIIFDIIGAIFVVTGLVGFCPLYAVLKFSTRKA